MFPVIPRGRSRSRREVINICYLKRKQKKYSCFLLGFCFFLLLLMVSAIIVACVGAETNSNLSNGQKNELLSCIEQARSELQTVKERLMNSEISLKEAKDSLTELNQKYQPVLEKLEKLQMESEELKNALTEWKASSRELSKQIRKLVWQRNIAAIWAAVSTVAYFIK
jgi:septal ring factor EnvC (AmiA/AmiB activator)